MDDNKDRKDNVLRLTLVERGDKPERRSERAFKAPFSDDLVHHAVRGQAELDKAYELRSKRLVKRLRDEVLANLINKDKKL